MFWSISSPEPSPAASRRRPALAAGLLLPGLLSAGLLLPPPAQAQDDRAAQEAQTQQKLNVIREEIAKLTSARNALDSERNDATRALREADQLVDRESRTLRDIDTRIQQQGTELARLEAQRNTLQKSLASQRQALASLLRSAYALGRHEQLKLLLAQDRIESLARVMAYHRYFQRDRVDRIDTLLEELSELADVVQQVHTQRSILDQSRLEQTQRIAELESVRETRANLVAELDARFKDTNSRLAALGRDEQALSGLLERLQDIFADIPERIDATQPFAQRKGRLSLPLTGRTLVTYGGQLPDGRPSQGLLIAAEPGAQVKAIAHGRVAFADWLKGYGLIIILDHGEGWMSLYAQNDSLHRDAGDWVNPGDTLASAGTSGGQSRPALYFELRRNGRTVNPKGWFR